MFGMGFAVALASVSSVHCGLWSNAARRGKRTACGICNWICHWGRLGVSRTTLSQRPGSSTQKTAWAQKALNTKGPPQNKRGSLE